ncbi:polysaccharide deacetylase family protein [Caulobacter segnis]|uniref:polysaccharide deacetylase family protein n=1 Tax=Caulobacter segnis TaxID=88688 RepID=UPI00240F8B9E|nr:polysaccharide deacetylase family protein [Caulobacter segnis]MDG2521152.1 polysaccharide deacetylase family protein [Caulobacter segnis]
MRRLLLGLAASLWAMSAQAQEIALTFDDLPAHAALPPGETRVGVTARLIAALADAGAPAMGFINGVQTEREPDSAAALDLWRAAGQPLANHTWSHMRLDDHSVAEFEADVARNEPMLKRRMGQEDWRWLRYPYLAEGKTPAQHAEARAMLARRGYRVAGVTLDFGDWAYNDPYARCAAKGDAAAIAELEARYIAGAAASLAYARALSKAALEREIPLVLLLHAGAFDARMMPRLLAFYRSEGVRFVTLETATRDAFYAPDVKPSGDAPTTLENAARAKGVAVPVQGWSVTGLDGVCR